jgi:hypothetical protein
MEQVEITQADRDAANKMLETLLLATEPKMFSPEECEAEIAQAFARHRLAAQSEAAATIERYREALEGKVWHPIRTALLWQVAVVTDGERFAKAQLARNDWGDLYWAIDPEDGLDWEPTLWTDPPALSHAPEGLLK